MYGWGYVSWPKEKMVQGAIFAVKSQQKMYGWCI